MVVWRLFGWFGGAWFGVVGINIVSWLVLDAFCGGKNV